MKMKYRKEALSLLIIMLSAFLGIPGRAQSLKPIHLSEDGKYHLKATCLAQLWGRYVELNPGSTLSGYPKKDVWDLAIRRYRLQLFGPVAERVFFYSQLGENNFSTLSDRKLGFFVHDLSGEYEFLDKKLSIGAGLNGWVGISRFSAPAAGAIMGVDAPLYLQTTSDVTDQFLRRMSVYAKGNLGALEYRLALAKPFAIQKSSFFTPIRLESSNYSHRPPAFQWNGYFAWQFRDRESNLLPYKPGTYLGHKKVVNLGAGFVYQPDAMWHLSGPAQDTATTDLLHLSAEFFADLPLGAKGAAFHCFVNYSYLDYGPRYLRNLAVLNPATGSILPELANGSGNGFPAFGTGQVFYAQIGYKTRDGILTGSGLMPYVSLQCSDYRAIDDPMLFWDIGCNFLLKEHAAKFTLALQNRPLVFADGSAAGRRNSLILQYNIFIQ